MRNTLVIVDDFLRAPGRLLEEAGHLAYHRSPFNRSSWTSQRSRYAARLSRRILQLAGVESIRYGTISGTYRLTTRDDVIRTNNAFFAHSDGILDFIAMIYLSLPSDCHGGTAFYEHKRTRLTGFQDLRAVSEVMSRIRLSFEELVTLFQHDAGDPSRWTQTDFVQMKHNRLIVYDGRMFHSHVFDFSKVGRSAKRLTFVTVGTTHRVRHSVR